MQTLRLIEQADRHFWRDVVPGDVLHSPGTNAFTMADFARRGEDTKVMTMGQRLLFVVSRHDGIPGDHGQPNAVTFVVLSRHGTLVVIQNKAP